MLATQCAHGLKEPWFGQNTVHVASDWLSNHAGDVITQLCKGLLECGYVIKWQRDGVLRQYFGHAGRAGHAKGERAGARFNQ